MSRFNVAKVIDSVPASPEPNTVYFVRKDEGFDIYVTNSDGVIVPRALNADIQAALLEDELEALSQVVDTKVDKVAGKQLSANDFTNSLKDKLDSLESGKFKGIFASLQALQDAIPVGEPGAYAHVDVELENAVLYIWDNTDSVWVSSGQEAAPLTAAQVKSLYEANANTNEFSDGEKTKLAGIAAEATKNATDAQLRDRATHTGTQGVETITGLGNASTATVTTSTTDTTAGRLLKVDHGVNLGSDQTVAGRKTFSAMPHTGGIADSTGGLGSIEVAGDAQKAAMITLHRHGAYAVYFGLDTDNKLKVGGWSMGATAHEIHHTGNWYLGTDKQHTASATGAVTLDLAAASIFDLTLTGNTTLAVSNATVPAGYSRSVVVRIRQGATPFTLAWWPGITWLASSTPAAPGANKVVEYVMSYSDTGWIGRVGAKN